MNVKEITSLQHPLIKHLVKLKQNHDYRYEKRSVVVEGIKPILEILPHASIKTLVATHQSLIPKEITHAELVLTTESCMEKLSGMKSPEGLLAEVLMPPFQTLERMQWILALDEINDPGNMGTLLRTALAFGWDGVFILNNSCDPYNEKVVKASRGAHFRLPLRMGNWDELEQLIKQQHLLPLAADLSGMNPQDLPKTDGKLLVLGNEARGISQRAEELCKKITLPMKGNMESLNVAIAGGILMYILKL